MNVNDKYLNLYIFIGPNRVLLFVSWNPDGSVSSGYQQIESKTGDNALSYDNIVETVFGGQEVDVFCLGNKVAIGCVQL